ncbi:helix-turn-helix domain-containing protein [Pseudomonas kuykendallii]|uniref:Transcriptional regulator, CdaR family n=1 Tax=Pseudomonas kuykendallii TaxID=1007099 RepID=A0A1H2X946_9PSED|nr:sugar diacid recognition domain-containing protein [Pseudomonas kuykendallii]MCQ4273224.1 helix-turn-helix domain-containing protein [Pseudomonas kuykendallii]SDW88994.1 transcriptional regulator, CdaR family [Pseudomonas kuykendallii]
MLELDSTLAQHIVDRAMAILPHNINVMDAQGMIIGSGDRERLHSRHEGAQLVLANRRTVEIDAQAAACLRGVKPGVNLPLLYADQLIGVLGITGDPEELRPYAALVRMTAEMLVEQRQLQAERHWQRHQLEAWLRRLLDRQQGLSMLAAEAERLGLQLGWPLQACLLHLQPGSEAQALLTSLAGRADNLCIALSAHELFWFRPWQNERDDAAWLSKADQRGWGVAKLMLSGSLRQLDDLREACLALRDLYAYGQVRHPQRRLLDLEGLRLQVLLFARRGDWLIDGWLQPLRELVEQDAGGILLETLEAWCAHRGQAQECAALLGIHRNTLRYRLERIAEISGLNPLRDDQRTHLALGLDLLAAG